MLSEEFVFLTRLLAGDRDAQTSSTDRVDCARLAELISTHRVMPETHAALIETEAPQIQKLSDHLQSAVESSIMHQMSVVQILSVVHSALCSRSISFLILKGAAVAFRWYPNPLQRDFNDIDILIRPVDVPHADTALKQAGFFPDEDLSLIELAHEIRYQHSRSYTHRLSGIQVDLHWSLMQRAYGILFDIDKVFARSEKVCINENSFRTLNKIDEFIFLCCHAAKHHWEKLRWVRDISLISKSFSPDDWQQVEQQAKQSKARTMVQDGKNLIDRLFPTAAPGASTVPSDPILDRYLEIMDTGAVLSIRERYRFDLHCQDSTVRKIRYLLCRIFIPHGSDRNWLALPERFGAAYWIVRPVRLFLKAVRV